MIRGWVRTSLIDYPEHVASVVFTGGCSFRCPMCHNAGLVLNPESLAKVDEEEVFAFLDRRAGLVDGFVVSGGEPTLQAGLPSLLRRVRERSLAIKLDTNGYHPECLQRLLEEGLLDYVAMDIKAPPDGYARLAGLKQLDMTRIAASIDLLRTSDVSFELRTTVVPQWLQEDDILAIGRWLDGAPHYVLQQFRPQGTMDSQLQALEPYPAEEIHAMAASVRTHFDRVDVRGV
ncbi:MAG: anaerobic ribonucleoside-triphosphate reductase activating protein [Anaerolineales bacterium]|nr:anaerobic ribonucleoside-triphosphate reductase activating protein [Anaerolineales bacterium]